MEPPNPPTISAQIFDIDVEVFLEAQTDMTQVVQELNDAMVEDTTSIVGRRYLRANIFERNVIYLMEQNHFHHLSVCFLNEARSVGQ